MLPRIGTPEYRTIFYSSSPLSLYEIFTKSQMEMPSQISLVTLHGCSGIDQTVTRTGMFIYYFENWKSMSFMPSLRAGEICMKSTTNIDLSTFDPNFAVVSISEHTNRDIGKIENPLSGQKSHGDGE